MLPVLPDFREQYPEVEIDVHISSRNVDFADDTYDLVATPGYLRHPSTPQSPEDLLRH